MTRVLKTILFAGTLLGLGIAQAQEAKVEPLHPGDTVKFAITFSGTDADKIKQVNAAFVLTSPPLANQPNFSQSFESGATTSATTTRTYLVELKVPDNIASGEYVLHIGATPSPSPGSIQYVAGQDFPLHSFRVENSRTLIKPSIKVVEQH